MRSGECGNRMAGLWAKQVERPKDVGRNSGIARKVKNKQWVNKTVRKKNHFDHWVSWADCPADGSARNRPWPSINGTNKREGKTRHKQTKTCDSRNCEIMRNATGAPPPRPRLGSARRSFEFREEPMWRTIRIERRMTTDSRRRGRIIFVRRLRKMAKWQPREPKDRAVQPPRSERERPWRRPIAAYVRDADEPLSSAPAKPITTVQNEHDDES